MTIEIRRVRRGDHAAHERFHAFVPLTFRGVDFRRWDERGGWNDDDEAWLLEHDGEAVASTGLTRMRLLVAGEECRGYQLGAVSTHPVRRGRGYSRILLAVERRGDTLVLRDLVARRPFDLAAAAAIDRCADRADRIRFLAAALVDAGEIRRRLHGIAAVRARHRRSRGTVALSGSRADVAQSVAVFAMSGATRRAAPVAQRSGRLQVRVREH